MAAKLTVTYTPQYQGAHRICFRTTQTAYCCYLDQSLTIIGLPKTTQIDLTEFESCLVDPPAELGCVASTLNGYVQPACEASDSLADIVTFNVTYPNPTICDTYQIQCNLSGVANIEVTNTGYGWLSGDVPTVTITDLNGLGIDATATAVMRCSPEEICQVDSIIIDAPGEFYYDPALVLVDISYPPGYSGELVVNGQMTSDLSGWTITAYGGEPDYIWEPLFGGSAKYRSADAGGLISQDILTVGITYDISFDIYVEPTDIDCTGSFIVSTGDTDTGYVTIPNITGLQTFTYQLTCTTTTIFSIFMIDSGPNCALPPDRYTYLKNVSVKEVTDSVPAEAIVTAVENCGTFTVPDCDGTANPTTYELRGGADYAINVCSGGTPDAPNYSIKSSLISCCNCVKYEVKNTAAILFDYYYVDCIDQTIKLATLSANSTEEICAVEGGVWVVNPTDNPDFVVTVAATQDC